MLRPGMISQLEISIETGLYRSQNAIAGSKSNQTFYGRTSVNPRVASAGSRLLPFSSVLRSWHSLNQKKIRIIAALGQSIFAFFLHLVPSQLLLLPCISINRNIEIPKTITNVFLR